MTNNENNFLNCKWIWINDSLGINQYVEFRQNFNVSNLAGLIAYISVDSDYELWLNGSFIGSNQYPNWPNEKTYNIHNVSSRERVGKNIIAVRVYYRGENFSTYAIGKPGLIFSLTDKQSNVICCSNSTWKCRISPIYKSGPVPKVTTQLGYTISYNAAADDDWQLIDYDDSLWCNTTEVVNPDYRALSSRPINELSIDEPLKSSIVQSGFINYNNEAERDEFSMCAGTLERKDFHRLNPLMNISNQPDKLKNRESLTYVPKHKGIYLIYDLGFEQTGLFDLVLTASKGIVINIGHGEHLDDGRVRAHIDGRNFIDQYITKSGSQHWQQCFRRLGCRYIQINIPKITGSIKIERATLCPVNYPFNIVRTPEFKDNLLKDIWDVSIRTLKLCAHEHYEDCPWREQSLYACDARLQALYGYYVFREYDFPANSWNLLSKGLRSDGLLELCAPAKIPINIPCFSLHWVIAVRELFEHSGQKQLVAHHLPVIRAILDTALSRLTQDNIVINSTKAEYWHFYEWSDGLSGDIASSLAGKNSLPRFDACYNLLLIDALRSAAAIDKQIDGYRDFAKRIADTFHDFFWDNNKKLYASYVNTEGQRYHFAQLVQALAVIQKVIPDDQVSEICSKIVNDKTIIKAELSSLYFIYEALLSTDLSYCQFVLNDIKEKFGMMIKQGATSLWETLDGSSAFNNAGSLCHGWSAVSIYFVGKYLNSCKSLKT